MTQRELAKLIAKGEGDKVEFKETTGQRTDACRTLCAFLNGNGGTVVFGVTKNGNLELPPDALREAVINALAHRSYTQTGGAVSIAVYDDRVEITNPGIFPPEIDMATVMDGNEHESLPRNERIADVLYMRKTIEAWGRGMRLIHHSCADAGVPPPVFTCDGHFVKATFARPSSTIQKAPTIQKNPSVDSRKTKVGGEAAEKQSEKRGRQTEMRGDASGGPARRTIKRTIKRSTKQLTNARVLDVIVRNPGVARPQIAIMIGRGLSATAKALSELQQSGKIEHRGSKKTGGYFAKETP